MASSSRGFCVDGFEDSICDELGSIFAFIFRTEYFRVHKFLHVQPRCFVGNTHDFCRICNRQHGQNEEMVSQFEQQRRTSYRMDSFMIILANRRQLAQLRRGFINSDSDAFKEKPNPSEPVSVGADSHQSVVIRPSFSFEVEARITSELVNFQQHHKHNRFCL